MTLDCLNNRYMDASTGTFLSVDPLVNKTGQAYLYGNGNPVTFSDPLGLESKGPGTRCEDIGGCPKKFGPPAPPIPPKTSPRSWSLDSVRTALSSGALSALYGPDGKNSYAIMKGSLERLDSQQASYPSVVTDLVDLFGQVTKHGVGVGLDPQEGELILYLVRGNVETGMIRGPEDRQVHSVFFGFEGLLVQRTERSMSVAPVASAEGDPHQQGDPMNQGVLSLDGGSPDYMLIPLSVLRKFDVLEGAQYPETSWSSSSVEVWVRNEPFAL